MEAVKILEVQPRRTPRRKRAALRPRDVVVLLAFMGLQPHVHIRVATGSAYFTFVVCAAIDHAPQPIPVVLIHTGPDVGEPARVRDQVDEKPVTAMYVSPSSISGSGARPTTGRVRSLPGGAYQARRDRSHRAPAVLAASCSA